MTYYEICSAYAEIENLDVDEIQDILDKSTDFKQTKQLFAPKGTFMSYCTLDQQNHVTSTHNLQRICRRCLDSYHKEIRQMVDSHRKQASCILDILILVAPAVAQQVSGLTAMTIVGTLTIMIKQSLLS